MVVTAQTPGAPSTADTETKTASPVTIPDSQPNQSGSNHSSSEDSGETSQGPSLLRGLSNRSVRHSERVRFATAALCATVALVAAVAVSLNPGEQPIRLVAFLVVGIASAVILTEAAASWVFRKRTHSVFDPLPLVGCALITTAAAWGSLMATPPVQTLLLITAPAIAVAALCLGNGLSILGANCGRADDQYLFPEALSVPPELSMGASITIRAGEIIPVDGRIESGSVGIDERAITPVAAFRIREEQEVVYAGSEVLAGTAQVTALSTPKDSCLAQLQSAVAPILKDAAESLRQEDSRASRWTAFAICFVATALAIAWRERSGQLISPLLAAGCVLLLGSICQVSEYLYGQRRSIAQRWLNRGFLLGSASSVRDLAHVSRIECDASRCGAGSLIRATHLEILDDRLALPALCDFLASLLGRAEDRMLLAAGEYCRAHASKLSLERVIELREYAGRGICGTVHGVELSIGSEDFLVERGIMVQPTDSGLEHEHGEPLLMVAIDDDVVARFWISTTQENLFDETGRAEASEDIDLVLSSGVSRDLGDETLLVRGNESDLIGQTAKNEVSLFSAKEGALRRTTIVAFNPSVAPLRRLVGECRSHIRSVDRQRLMVGFGGLVTVSMAFAGIFTPLIPCAWLVLTAIAVRHPRSV
jgi:hypothetical protein